MTSGIQRYDSTLSLRRYEAITDITSANHREPYNQSLIWSQPIIRWFKPTIEKILVNHRDDFSQSKNDPTQPLRWSQTIIKMISWFHPIIGMILVSHGHDPSRSLRWSQPIIEMTSCRWPFCSWTRWTPPWWRRDSLGNYVHHGHMCLPLYISNSEKWSCSIFVSVATWWGKKPGEFTWDSSLLSFEISGGHWSYKISRISGL